MAKRRLRILQGAAGEIGWMALGVLTLAVLFAIVLGFINFARNESTSSHVREVQRSVVKVSVCADHPHSKLCLKGITRAVRTCLEDPTCHALLATGIRGPISQKQSFSLHNLSEALVPALTESGGIAGLDSPVPVRKAPSASEQRHVEKPKKLPPAEPEPLPNTPALPTTDPPQPHPPEEQPVTRSPGPSSQTIEPPEAVLPVLPSEGEQKCVISVLGVQICTPIGE